MQIDVLHELHEYGIRYNKVSNGEEYVAVRCPFHGDNNPSCHVHIKNRRFKCHGCNKTGTFISLLARLLSHPIAKIYNDLAKKYGDPSSGKTINPKNVEIAHELLLKDPKGLVENLKHRGINDECIRNHRLGRYQDCITIPVLDGARNFVNIRYHRPGDTSGNKVFNVKGHGKPIRLFPLEQLEYDTILITGGELKAIAAAFQLNNNPNKPAGCVTTTGGEGSWDHRFTSYFDHKIIYICCDLDKAGQKANLKLAAAVATAINSQIYLVHLPLDPEKYPKGDINDYIKEGGDVNDLLTPEHSTVWEPKLQLQDEYDVNEAPIEVSFEEALKADNTTKKISLKTVVSSMDTAPYTIPKTIEILCPRDQDYCQACPVFLSCKPDEQVLDIGQENPNLLDMVGQKKSAQHDALKRCMSIPKQCNLVDFETKAYYNIEDLRISGQLEITDRSAERPMQAAYCIADNNDLLEMNESYTMSGRVFPHPQTQQATFLISSFEPTLDSLSSYEPSLDGLGAFQPKEWTLDSLKEKLNEIYEDLEANVTRIFQRRDLHLCIDLCYHSPLFFMFDDEVCNGWVEVLIVGDSAQGKTETLASLLDHYGLGEIIECKGVTEAGLKGGLQQTSGNRWFVTWGVFPMNDKRLVALDELKGASEQVISKLTYMRSSGIAEITKIEKRRTPARTRCIALSNPRRPKPMSSYNYGVDAILELIGSLEDVRRFTMCMVVDRKEVDSATLQSYRPKVEHKYTDKLSRELILWAWTLNPKDITFENEQYILDAARKMCEEYTDDIPIVDRGEFRLKLAKLCISLAVRTYSIDKEGKVLVRKCHVEFMVEYLRRIYNSPSFGYADISKKAKELEFMVNPEEVKDRILNSTYPVEFVEHLLKENEVTATLIQDLLNLEYRDSREFISFFLRQRAISREKGNIYAKTPAFTALLKKMEDGNVKSSVPDYMKREKRTNNSEF